MLGVEGGLLVVTQILRIATINVALLEGLEACVGCILLLDVAVCDVLRSMVLNEPEVGILSAFQYTLKRKCYGAGIVVVAPRILRSGIAQ